jgi:hypothetical protein
MEGLSSAASVIAVIDLSAKIASLCYQYLGAVKEAKKDIERLEAEINSLQEVLGGIRHLLDRPENAMRLEVTHKVSSSLDSCREQLEIVQRRLEPGKTRKTMSRFGVRAFKWPFKSKEVDKIIQSLNRHKTTLASALQLDQT